MLQGINPPYRVSRDSITQQLYLLYWKDMKNLTLLFLFAASIIAAHAASADTAATVSPSNVPQTNTTPVWPSAMPVYRWPTKQMINQPSVRQSVPMYSAPQAVGVMPIAPRYPSPYSAMQYPSTNTVPPVLRYPANQTFQQARPVYNFNTPYGSPMVVSPYAPQYRYPARTAPQAYYSPQVATQPRQNMAAQPPYKQVFPARKKPEKKKKKPWGDTRHIWPDFYTDATGDLWDDMMNAPYDMGRMPGGWRAPSLSTPDPVTVGDAVANQIPPVIDEVPNFMPLMN